MGCQRPLEPNLAHKRILVVQYSLRFPVHTVYGVIPYEGVRWLLVICSVKFPGIKFC